MRPEVSAVSLVVCGFRGLPQPLQNIASARWGFPQFGQVNSREAFSPFLTLTMVTSSSVSGPPHFLQKAERSGKVRSHFEQCFIA